MATTTTTTRATATARAAKATAQRERIAAKKVARGCDICGTRWEAGAAWALAKQGQEINTRNLSLQLIADHINPADKAHNIADMFGRYSDAAIDAEFAKTRGLCTTCNNVYTFLVQRAR